MKSSATALFLPANRRFILFCVENSLVFRIFEYGKASPAATAALKLWNILLFIS